MYIVGTLCAIGAGIFFGFIGPVTKVAYNLGVGLGLAILLRYLIATILISPFLFKNKPTFSVYKNQIWLLMILTSGSILLTTGLLISVKYIDASLAILIFCTYPIIVLFTSMLIDKEQIDLKIKLVFLITFLGLFLVLGPSFDSLNTIGVISAIIASIGASTIILTNQKLSNRNINPIHINAFTNLFNSIFFIIVISVFFEIKINISLNAWIMILTSALCYAVAFFLQLLAIPRIGQSKTALLLYTEPIVAVLASMVLLKEILNLYQFLGAIIVISSLIFATYHTNKN
ncbi:DMT family transporter [Alphaproteobacteria bacterium]|nr:DMT family transporter [Alphaproteobacteria bacterium]